MPGNQPLSADFALKEFLCKKSTDRIKRKNDIFVAEFSTSFQNNWDKPDREPRLYWGENLYLSWVFNKTNKVFNKTKKSF